MKIFLHIGLPYCGADQLQKVMDKKRGQLAKKSILYPQSPGRKNHTRLLMALTDPGHKEPLREHRGHGPAQKQAELRDKLRRDLQKEIDKVQPDVMILSTHQLSAVFFHPDELSRLRDVLAEFSEDITIVMHVDEQARVLVRHYGEAILSGRVASLDLELALQGDWISAEDTANMPVSPQLNQFPEIQAAPFWLDYLALVKRWQTVFGPQSVRLRAYDPDVFNSNEVMQEAVACFDLPDGIGKAGGGSANDLDSEQSLAQARAVNRLLAQAMAKGQIVDRQTQHKIIKSVLEKGTPIDPGSLLEISDYFAGDNRKLLREFPDIGAQALRPLPAAQAWSEPPLESSFKPRKVIEDFQNRIDKLTKEHRAEVAENAPTVAYQKFLSKAGGRLLPQAAKDEIAKLAANRFAPHNNIGSVDESAILPQYTPLEPRNLGENSTGNVIIACMKNEAPYIIEWIAYHRSIGVDGFIIYTNDCSDGTTEILDRLQDMGVIVHENNDKWKGNSPQQAALNRAIEHKLVKKADWVAHIDVDEFINVRFGNGSLPEFIERIGDATNVAMTWRLFGHNGVSTLADEPVIGQFDRAAPKYCPKPHTVWGFKTLYRNINAYEKVSCHRTTKLREGKRDKVKWVNGNGVQMGGGIEDGGWRSSLKTIGYDLIQLNHYALRSAESYLIKRQRGRALHVDRSIGINYWLRMDFNAHQDVTIQRNLDRTNAEIAVFKQDKKLADFHQQGLEWHRAKALELHAMPEFEDLFQQALDMDLNDIERVAWCLVNDMES